MTIINRDDCNFLLPVTQALLPPSESPQASAIDKLWSLADVHWMNHALALAKQGAKLGEVPVGAVLIHNGKIIAQGFNEPIGRHDATAHAEIIAIRQACLQLNNYRLPANTTLYVTLEPCTMCVGAMIHARVNRLIFATREPKAGMVSSQINLPTQEFYNHRLQVFEGLGANASSLLLKRFFKQRRQTIKISKAIKRN